MELCDRLDTSALADVYADGWCAVDNLGATFRQVFFVWNRDHAGLLVRVPVACLVRPHISTPPNGRIAALLRAQTPPGQSPIALLGGMSCN